MAAAKTLSPHPFPPISLPSKSKLSRNNTELFTHHHNRQPWRGQAGAIPTRQKRVMVRVSVQLQEHLLSSSLLHFFGTLCHSVPGLWSLIKRSVKSKIVQKTFIGEGGGKKEPAQVAGEILSFFTRNNFSVTARGEAITFEGIMVPNRGQAALLTFCTCISLASVALVLTITFPDFGNNWFWITILSPLAGAYYWKRASRKEEIKVKMMVADDGTLSEIVVQGDDQQVEQMRKELQFSEKGMVYVKGIFER
ncbi:protein COFACTOR ASSEMBLY OF COMPLEX [Salix suchowensis]|nr:protein COFACTOR ASSEMBLY OF COMPLEX [Salix suchowensis]